ncbi:MAG: HD-GYP domain-containing protein [Lachnospiraceae bacterium]|nr:HD-GYP domain-containing protein [Lachnospiraceae bacterium]
MDNNAETIDINDSIGWSIFSVVWNIMPAVAYAFFYTQIVLPLSRISKNGIRADKKIFVIPVSILIAVYSVITNYYGLNKTSLNMAIEYAYSAIVMCLVMWAFAVIIRNIAATNEAIEAKDKAVEAQNQIKELSVEVMEALAHTIDAKDEYTRGHSVRVAEYSRMIAERMKLSQEECEDAYYMGLLHDLGKIGVPNEIINSPTRLTDEQYDVIKTHPVTGFDILAEIKTRPDLVTGARWHHERYDGKGYPDGKSGEDIPLMARIIAVADSYDAMTSNRSYRKYMAQEKVRSEIEKNSGTQFDPIIAKVMIEIIDDDKDYLLHE